MRETWPIWQRVVLGAVLAATIALLVVAAAGNGGQQQEADAWSADLQAWEDGLDELPQPVRLSDVVDGTGREEVDGGPGAVDAINAACAEINALAEDVAARSGPPDAPAGLDPGSSQAADVVDRHEQDRTAWQDHVAQTAAPTSLVRSFCGTYPALARATVTEVTAADQLVDLLGCADGSRSCLPASDVDAAALDAATTGLIDGVRGRADSLAAGCYLADLAAYCSSEAAAARELLDSEQAWVDALATGDAAALAEAAQASSTIRARPVPDDVVALGLGEDRDALAASAVALVQGADDTIETARADLIAATG